MGEVYTLDAIIEGEKILCGKCGRLLATRKYPDKPLDGKEVLKEPNSNSVYWSDSAIEILCRNKNEDGKGFCKTLNIIKI